MLVHTIVDERLVRNIALSLQGFPMGRTLKKPNFLIADACDIFFVTKSEYINENF